jgi:hypothetical protein
VNNFLGGGPYIEGGTSGVGGGVVTERRGYIQQVWKVGGSSDKRKSRTLGSLLTCHAEARPKAKKKGSRSVA